MLVTKDVNYLRLRPYINRRLVPTSKGLLCSDQLSMKNCLEATASLGHISSKCSEITFGGKRPNMAKCAFNSQRHFLFQQQV